MSGGYAMIKTEDDSKSPFIDEVNKRLGDYWVANQGRERNIENVMFEVLAEMYDKLNPKPND
jgi:hypothetical protein